MEEDNEAFFIAQLSYPYVILYHFNVHDINISISCCSEAYTGSQQQSQRCTISSLCNFSSQHTVTRLHQLVWNLS